MGELLGMGLLDIADEVVTGFGRLGPWSAFEQGSRFVPPILVLPRLRKPLSVPLEALESSCPLSEARA